MDITELLAFSVKNKASDLHLSAGLPPMIRVHGDIRRINLPPMEHKEVHALVYDIMNDQQRKMYEENKEIDFSFEVPGLARFRVNAFVHNRGAGAVMRTIPSKILSLEDLKAPKIFESIADFPRGMVLVTGPTGSGKSTTLAAMVNHRNETEMGHILTVEDPIEFVHESKKSLVNQREVGPHTLSFQNALRSALREDPDIILVARCVIWKPYVWRCLLLKLATWCLARCIPAPLRKLLTVSLTYSLRMKRKWCVRCCLNRCARLFLRHC
jgi:twitching motility protein PilT